MKRVLLVSTYNLRARNRLEDPKFPKTPILCIFAASLYPNSRTVPAGPQEHLREAAKSSLRPPGFQEPLIAMHFGKKNEGKYK